MKKRIVILLVAVLFGTTVKAQIINWTRKSSLPIPLSKSKAAVADGKIYVMGGVSPTLPETFATVNYEYNPQTDAWTKKADMPTGRSNFAMAEVDGKIYVIGGFENVCCPPFPERCNWEECAKISDLNEVYDPKINTWETLSPLPTKRHGVDMATVNGKIYVIGGMGTEASIWEPQNTVEEYTPKTNKWATKQPMPTPRDGYGYSVQGEQIFVYGGWIGVRQQTNTTIVYEIEKNTWVNTTNLPIKTGACAYATIDNKIYFFGGDKEDFSEIFSFTYEGEVLSFE